ncbi:MAG: polysaccharide deacetylase family protein [Microcoleaceae cyanobacterium]
MAYWIKQRLNVRFGLRLWGQLICFLLLFAMSLTLTGASQDADTVRVPIFGFHDIIDLDDPQELPPNRPGFESDYTKQNLYPFLNYLVDQNYWFLSTQDLYTYFIKRSEPVPEEYLDRKPVMITFDDGYYSAYKNVLPILKDLERNYGEIVKVVLFINPKYTGAKMAGYLPHISCEEMQEGYRLKFYDIQSHGHTHQQLTRLKFKGLQEELGLAKNSLRKCLKDLDTKGWTSAHIAYPFGASSKRVEKSLPQYYLTGYLYDDTISRPNKLRNPYRISRIRTNLSMSPSQLIKIAERATLIRKEYNN